MIRHISPFVPTPSCQKCGKKGGKGPCDPKNPPSEREFPMKKPLKTAALLLPALILGGCAAPAEKSVSLSAAYAVIALLSLLLLIGCCCLVKKRNIWLLLLFTSVLVVNAGYFALSISKTLEEALLANRISYLGSVFLPFAMLMIILEAAAVKCKKWLPAALLLVSLGVFLVAASPGYLDIYYKEVSLHSANGVTVLDKVYGPWHKLYFYYLFLYFAAMIAATAHAIIKKKLPSGARAVILAFAVFINIGVWLMEQLIRLDFELLSLSYIISELFLLGLFILQEEDKKEAPAPAAPLPASSSPFSQEQRRLFLEGLLRLTPAERTIYDLYLQGKTTREITDGLGITENTLKYHNKNLYGKLGVSSRRQLVDIALTIKE